jgi:hypothetical protein
MLYSSVRGYDFKRLLFSENIRDGFTFDPIEVEPCLDKPGWYSLLEGALYQQTEPACEVPGRTQTITLKRRVVPVEIQKMLQGSGRIRIRLL